MPMSPRLFKFAALQQTVNRGLAMRSWGQQKKAKARIEIIPMIDVMMFLLVFFVLISINVIPAMGIKTKLPSSSQSQDLKSVKNAIVTLAKTGEVQLDGKATELAQLAARIKAQATPQQKVNVIINGDAGVEMQRLIDVMDALKEGGLESISIAAKKKA
jgi:biopolymer transport protein ExbD